MKTLIVDDYRTMRRIIRNLLMQLGYNDVEDVGDGAAALALMRADKFDLVICDWNMEPMSGLELLKQIRSDAKLKSTPFIMVLAENKQANVTAAKEAGINEYIIKPFNAESLLSKIRASVWYPSSRQDRP